jgi:hypothetical protein
MAATMASPDDRLTQASQPAAERGTGARHSRLLHGVRGQDQAVTIPPGNGGTGGGHAGGDAERTGLEPVEPGLVQASKWQPGSEAEAGSPAALWAGVARKS